MLVSLAIRDVVLIERIDLDFGTGLTALTGETGAGKSIILDALGLALGARGERGLVRHGAAQASVTAQFEAPADHPARAFLREQALDVDGEIVLRRSMTADGRSRAFVNGEPVNTTLLRRLGERLVEVHGQMDQRGLLDARTHRSILDAFGGYGSLLQQVRSRYAVWRQRCEELEARRLEVERAHTEEDFLRYRAQELRGLDARPDEEDALASERARLLNREKIVGVIQEALDRLSGREGAAARLSSASRRLERVPESAREILSVAVAAIERATIEAVEAEAQLEELLRSLERDERGLEAAEERLFRLREVARKHRVTVNELPALLEETEASLAALESGLDDLHKLEVAVEEARQHYVDAAHELGRNRSRAAAELSEQLAHELPPLKLERARLVVRLEPLGEANTGPEGMERVEFEVTTNPGQAPGPLSRIASGGELSRLMLALKVVLARVGSTGTLIFDEVDAGIGGATAHAVGERLARLAAERQVLVVTHAPQIAARADQHLTVAKSDRQDAVMVDVRTLEPRQRRDEVARMLAGAEITEAARTAADSLLTARG